MWLDGTTVCQITACRGFDELYRQTSFGVLHRPAPDGTVAYTVAKRTDFVAFDVRRFLALACELEPGWGGGSSIGGAPRDSRGRRSRLAVPAVARLLQTTVRRSVNAS